MNLLKSLFDSIAEIFIKFASYLPSGNNIDTSSYITTIQSIKGYINWFLPIDLMLVTWNGFVIIIMGVTVGFIFLKWARQGFIKI